MAYTIAKYLIITVICFMVPCIALAEQAHKEIYEFDSIPVNGENIENLTEGEKIEAISDLSVPNSSILSIDINKNGDLLVCFTDRIIVFDEKFIPVKAYLINKYSTYFERGTRPFAMWNQKSGNIVYMQGDGYEFNDKGLVVRKFEDVVYKMHNKITRVKWSGKVYELQNHTYLPQIKSKKNKTYSTLVLVDENGKETILCESLRSQYLGQLWEYLWFIPVVIGLCVIIKEQRRKAKLRQMQYGNIQIAELYKRVRVKRRPAKVKMNR